MADGDAPSSSAAQPLSSTGELALPGSGTVTSSGRRCVVLLVPCHWPVCLDVLSS